MRVAVIGQPGAWSTERLAGALRDAGAEAPVVDLTACSVRLPETGLYHGGLPLEGLAGAFVKKIGDTADGAAVLDRINLLRHLEASGIPVVSAPASLEAAVNRYRMTVELVRAGLPVPETIVTEDVEEAVAGVERFGAAVLKPLYTSKGRGMRLLEPGPDLRAVLATGRPSAGALYLQRFVKHPGRDLGVTVLEGRYLGAYWRLAGKDQWMTTILSGGHYERANPPPEAVDLALRAARHFGLMFTGVDLMETPDGGFTVLEVSAFGGFRGLLAACGVDAPPLVARAILERLSGLSR